MGTGLQIFTISLIADKIFSHLNFGDFLLLRELCSILNQSVITSKHFLDKSMLIVLKSTNKSCIRKSVVQWHNLQIDVGLNPLKILPLLTNFLPFVKSLWIVIDRKLQPNDSQFIEFISELFKRAENLENLKLPCYPGFMNWDIQIDLAHLFSRSSSNAFTKNLAGFELTQVQGNLEGDINLFAPIVNFMTNLRSLDVSVLQRYDYTGGAELVPEMKEILNLVRRNQHTLQNLKLPSNFFLLEDSDKICCPTLRNLSLEVCGSSAYNSFRFINLQPTLGHLQITFHNSLSNHPPYIQIFHNVCKSLVSIEVKFQDIDSQSEYLFEPGIISEYRQLQSFKYETMSKGSSNILRLLESLPPILTELSVKYSDPSLGFPSLLDTHTQRKIDLLSTFRNLQVLRLLSFSNCVTNEMMQAIYKNLSHLKVFEFISASDQLFTKEGLTGQGRDDAGVGRSIKCMTELRELGIHRNDRDGGFKLCTDLITTSHFRFQHLAVFKYITLFDDDPVTIHFLTALVKQNPSLERLETTYVPLELHEMKKRMRKYNPRFNSFRDGTTLQPPPIPFYQTDVFLKYLGKCLTCCCVPCFYACYYIYTCRSQL